MTAKNSKHEPLLIPNKFGRMLLQAYEEVLGHEGITAIENLAGLHHLIQHSPPDNFDPQFCADDMGRIHEMMEKKYGPHAGRGIALRAGQVCFKYGLKEFGSTIGVSELDFRLLPLHMKIEKGVQNLAKLAREHASEGIEINKTPEFFSWLVQRCPLCWQREAETPCCHLAVGLFQEALFWISGGKNYLVEETSCIATGDPTCTFKIARKPLD
jgi:predicted hydrocarbon binding protein